MVGERQKQKVLKKWCRIARMNLPRVCVAAEENYGKDINSKFRTTDSKLKKGKAPE